MDESGKALTDKAFLNREYAFHHSSYEKEFEFYECVKKGDLERVQKLITPLGSHGFGVLSENKLQNLKYHFAIMVALITRFCVEGGMEMEEAYTLSDIYISKADKCTLEAEIHKLHTKAILDFTSQMKRKTRETVYSRQINKAMDYIYNHLHSKILIQELAACTGLSTSYLSRLFHKEVGVTISEYISLKRIEAAQNMLKYSDYASIDIGNRLAFATHSHFISTFRRYTGITPGEYRKKYYRSNWETPEALPPDADGRNT